MGVSSRDRGEILRYDIGGWLSESLAFHLAALTWPHMSGVQSVFTRVRELPPAQDFIRPR